MSEEKSKITRAQLREQHVKAFLMDEDVKILAASTAIEKAKYNKMLLAFRLQEGIPFDGAPISIDDPKPEEKKDGATNGASPSVPTKSSPA